MIEYITIMTIVFLYGVATLWPVGSGMWWMCVFLGTCLVHKQGLDLYHSRKENERARFRKK